MTFFVAFAAMVALAAATDYCVTMNGCSACQASPFGCQWCAGSCMSKSSVCAPGADTVCCDATSFTECLSFKNQDVCDWCGTACAKKGSCSNASGTPSATVPVTEPVTADTVPNGGTTAAPATAATPASPVSCASISFATRCRNNPQCVWDSFDGSCSDRPSGCASLDVFSCSRNAACSFNSDKDVCQNKSGPCADKDQIQCSHDGQQCQWDVWANSCGDAKPATPCSTRTSLSACSTGNSAFDGNTCSWCFGKCVDFGDCIHDAAKNGVTMVQNIIIIVASVVGGVLLLCGIIVAVIVCQNNKKKTNVMPAAVFVAPQQGVTQQGVPPTFAPGNAAGVQQGAPPAAFRQPAPAPVVHQSPVPSVYRGPAQQI